MSYSVTRVVLVATCSIGLFFDSPTVAEANHRRGVIPRPSRHCQPIIYSYGATTQASGVTLQPAAIPPAMVPVLMNVGQEIGSVALDRLIDRLRQQLGNRDLSPDSSFDSQSTVTSNTEIEDISSRLEKLAGKLKLDKETTTTPSGRGKGRIRAPQGKPIDMPEFR